MADDFRTHVQDLQRSDAANQSCIECGAPNPQWASLSYGTYFCLECSGLHRGLGVHLSFVRSITMDKWTEDQYRKMQHGGNARFAAFAAQNPDLSGAASVKDKYGSRAAAVYRAKLVADVQGTPFNPATVEWTPPSLPHSHAGTPAMGGASPASFGAASLGASPQQGAPMTMPSREQNEDYFGRMGMANAARPEHLPPSQGGRYVGFGSSGSSAPAPASTTGPGSSFGAAFAAFGGGATAAATQFDPTQIINDPVSALTKGWSLFSTVATAAVGTAVGTVGTVVTKGTQLVQDPNFQSQVARGVSQVGDLLTQVGETAMVAGTRAYASVVDAPPRNGQPGSGFYQQAGYGAVPQSQQGQQTGGGDFFAANGATAAATSNNNPFGGAAAASDPFGTSAPFSSSAAAPAQSHPFDTTPPADEQPPAEGMIIPSSSSEPIAAGAGTRNASQRKQTKKTDDWDEW
ncbi:Zn finger-containing GTPase- Activating Protein for ARF [Blastocladiella emersonii ATCC 22665]|nr:Zn finger-containing GTPase- Activating Protein for ARF [Blastocladiella emersonii ATCC 22665]